MNEAAAAQHRRAVIARLKEQNANMQKQWQDLYDELQARLDEAIAHIAELVTKLATIENARDASHTACAEFEKRIVKLQAELAMCRLHAESLLFENTELRGRLPQ